MILGYNFTFKVWYIVSAEEIKEHPFTGAFFIQESEDEMGVRVVFPDMGKDPSVQLIEKTITENGTYDAITDGANGYSSVTVNVEGGGGSSDLTWILPEQTVTLVDQPVEVTGLRLDLIPDSVRSVPLKLTHTDLSGNVTNNFSLTYFNGDLATDDGMYYIGNVDGKDVFVVSQDDVVVPGTYTISIALF